MLLDAALGSVREGLPFISWADLYCILGLSPTFAISPQPIFSSRILFNNCSSSGVQGVFVLGFFLPTSSRAGVETDGPLLADPRGLAGGGSVFSGLLVGSGLAGERGRLRGLGGDGGRTSTSVVVEIGGMGS